MRATATRHCYQNHATCLRGTLGTNQHHMHERALRLHGEVMNLKATLGHGHANGCEAYAWACKMKSARGAANLTDAPHGHASAWLCEDKQRVGVVVALLPAMRRDC